MSKSATPSLRDLTDHNSMLMTILSRNNGRFNRRIKVLFIRVMQHADMFL